MARHGAKSLAQIFDKMVRNKLRIHDAYMIFLIFCFPIYKVNLISYVLGIRIN